jgi:hypothetical protein
VPDMLAWQPRFAMYIHSNLTSNLTATRIGPSTHAVSSSLQSGAIALEAA